MTDLSPAAQAVLKAACIHHGLFNEEVVQRRRSIAAALRAAAYETDWESGDPKLLLEGIAAELEGAQ